jgi:hypothetical protein
MMILWVVPSLAVSVLLFALAYGQMRKPNPTAFFAAEPTASAFAMFITAFFALALAGMALNLDLFLKSALALPFTGQVLLAALPIGAVLLAPVLMRPALHPRSETRTSAEIVQLPPRGPSQSGRTPPASGHKHRRAA